MKKLTYLLVLSGLISAPLAAIAEDSPVSGNIGITTDYIFRGISQTQHKPAISGGFDYAHSSGLYVGTWMSNQGWVNAGGYKANSSMEIDLYGGYRGAISDDFGYDVGLITYYYPGDKVAGVVSPDTTEAYLSLSWKTVSLKYSNAVSDYFVGYGTLGTVKTKGSDYLELNASYDLGEGWGVLGHVGHQSIKHISASDYTDWKVGVTKDIGYGTVTLAYSDTDADPIAGAYWWGTPAKDVSKGVLALSFAKSF